MIAQALYMEENLTNLRSLLLKRFKGHWEHLKQAIDKIPEDRFHEGPVEWTCSYIVYHIIETAEFYLGSSPDLMKWGKKAGYDWKKNSEEEIEEKKLAISKSMVRSYTQEIEQSFETFLQNTTDSKLLEKDDFPWFDSILGKLMYLLQHNYFHLGELAGILRQMDVENFKW